MRLFATSKVSAVAGGVPILAGWRSEPRPPPFRAKAVSHPTQLLLSARISTVPGAPSSRATGLALLPGLVSPLSFNQDVQAATGSAGGSCGVGSCGRTGLRPFDWITTLGVRGAVASVGVAATGVWALGFADGEAVGRTDVVPGPPATAESCDGWRLRATAEPAIAIPATASPLPKSAATR